MGKKKQTGARRCPKRRVLQQAPDAPLMPAPDPNEMGSRSTGAPSATDSSASNAAARHVSLSAVSDKKKKKQTAKADSTQESILSSEEIPELVPRSESPESLTQEQLNLAVSRADSSAPDEEKTQDVQEPSPAPSQ